MRWRNPRPIFGVLLTILVSGTSVQAAPVRFKAGTLAPEGSPWLNTWNEFVAHVEANSGVDAKIVTYPGGVMGDEADMVRKLKFGQLQMVGVTVAGIAHLMPEILVLNLPFLFNNYDEVDYVVGKLFDRFQEIAATRGLYLVGLLDQGWIEAYSKRRVGSPEEFIKQRVWIWNEDRIALTLAKKLGINGVMLPVPEVLTSLQTGLIDSMFSSSTALVSLQWHTQMKYYYPFRLRYDPAAFMISEKALKKLAPADQQKFRQQIRASWAETFGKAAADFRKTEQELARQVVDGGVEVVQWDRKAADGLIAKARETWKELAGDLYPAELLDDVLAALKAFRAAH
ncbi:MAG: hypothetical protein D6761_07470 [Candidatus Dadabacteria bacterium]|nr:MAG: hypothetical protein D6761_07470 [Candidatus Dadabacteria bacterium]